MKRSFGTLPSGEQASLYTISCGKLTASVTGAGQFIAIGSGNPCTEENFTDSRVTFRGKAMVCARAAKEIGELVVKVTAEGLPEATLSITVE